MTSATSDTERARRSAECYERAAASPAVAAAMTRAMYASDVRQELARICCPTLIVHTGDYLHISKGHSKHLAENINGASYLEGGAESLYRLDADAGRQYIEFLTGHRDEHWSERELAVVVFTDIVGSTSQLASQGDRRWQQTLEDCNDVVVREVGRFGGRVIKQTGDGHLLTFPSPGTAISAVLGIRRAGPVLGVSFRIGLHMGEIEVRDGDIAGITVHAASRIADLAGAGQVLLSGVVADLLSGTGLDLAELGRRSLRGLPGKWHILSLGGARG